MLEEEVRKITYIEQLLSIKDVGIVTIAWFLSKTGNISRFTAPKQIQKLAGLKLKETSSGNHKGLQYQQARAKTAKTAKTGSLLSGFASNSKQFGVPQCS